MPLVKAVIANRLIDIEAKLGIAASEIVPAGVSSVMGPLSPNCIEFFPVLRGGGMMSSDVFLEIEAYDKEDRRNLEERAAEIKSAFSELFPDITFAVWLKLVQAGWASNSSDDELDVDMSMKAAIERVKSHPLFAHLRS